MHSFFHTKSEILSVLHLLHISIQVRCMWQMTALLDSPCLNCFLLPSPTLFFLPSSGDHAQPHTSSLPIFHCQVSSAVVSPIFSGCLHRKMLCAPSLLLLLWFYSSSLSFLLLCSCLLGAKNCPCPRSAGWWAKWFIPRRGGLHPPQEGSKGFEGAVFRCFSKTISFFQFPSEQTKFTKSWATFFSHLSFPGILLGVKYKCILLLEVIFVWQKHFTLIKIKMSIQFLKFKMLVLT